MSGPAPAARRAALLDALWPAGVPPGGVFAVLDGARDARVASRVGATVGEKACLYAGTLPPSLISAAPHLVRLSRDDWFCRALLDDGWGRAWGVFLHADTSLASLRRHLRRFLVVRDQRGRRLVFRWYDPRVLRVYLPTCTPEELREVFGPVTAFLVEAPEPTTLVRFARDGEGRLTETRVTLPSG